MLNLLFFLKKTEKLLKLYQFCDIIVLAAK